MKKERGFLEELFGVDDKPSLLFPDKKGREGGRKKRQLSNLEECPNCGTLFPTGGSCPGCGLTDEEMSWREG